MLLTLRTCAEIGALVLFAVSILTLLNQRRELDLAVKQVNQELALERKRKQSAALMQASPTALQSLQPAMVLLNLVRPGLQRGEQDLPEVKVDPGTKILHVEVAVSSRPSANYRVQLQHVGETIWSDDSIAATAVQGGTILELDIPAEILPQGVCELAVMPSGESKVSYWFAVSRPNIFTSGPSPLP